MRAPAGLPVVVVEDFGQRPDCVDPARRTGFLFSDVSPSTMASGMMTAQGRDAPAQGELSLSSSRASSGSTALSITVGPPISDEIAMFLFLLQGAVIVQFQGTLTRTAEERLGGSVADWYQVKKCIHYVAIGIHHSGDKRQMLHCSLVSRFVDKQRELLSAQEFTDVLGTLLSKNIFYDGSALRPATAHILCNLGIIACCFDNVN
ncbi:hypothetical protein MRX96_029708 [Rhipicephalus microplus]